MNTNYKKVNYGYWQSEYQTDFPDTFLVKLYHHIVKNGSNFKKSKKRLKLLDYGCGNGTNALFFYERNFDAFGVDINRIAIKKAKEQSEDPKSTDDRPSRLREYLNRYFRFILMLTYFALLTFWITSNVVLFQEKK